VSKKDIAHAKGYVSGIRESGWQCGDCGNFYDATVDHCPNRLLDEALVGLRRTKSSHRVHMGAPKHSDEAAGQFGYRAPERTHDGKVVIVGPYATREEAEVAADGLPVVELPPTGQHADTGALASRSHLADCPCADGPCCPWMGDCTCQCLCEFIARIEDRVRAEYDPSENDADEGYRTGYATAVAEFMSNHGDDATFQLGYKKALLDVIEKARTGPAAAFATVEELMQDLNEEAP
jgi:hypothetical protein